MRTYRSLVIMAAVLMLPVAAGAQNPQTPPPAPDAPPVAAKPSRQPIVPLEIQVVIARYQGEKRVSSMPYVMAVNANGAPASLNMGADVAIPSGPITTPADGRPSPPVMYSYKNIGTNIVCGATTADEGRFEVNVSIDDSSVFMQEDGSPSTNARNMPAFRSFKSRNTLVLRDGQTRQYTAATDRVSSETLRIEVTLKVVK
jgi:hypothetical protein